MLRPTLLLITVLIAAGCLHRAPSRSGAVAEVSLGPAASPVIAGVPAIAAPAGPAKSPAEGGDTLFGARFEPPRGRILHGLGALEPGNAGYLELLADPAIMPAFRNYFWSIGDSPRGWDRRLQRMRVELQREAKLGRIPHFDIGLYGIDPGTGARVGVDHEVASGRRYDTRIRELAQVIASHPDPVFMRIGGEFSGDWMDYHPWDYPIAFRKVVEMFRAEGADNVAFVWCYQPAAPDDFDQRDSRGWRWFPGDDVVDWFGIDLFARKELVQDRSARGLESSADRTERFLAMAREHRKPVMIGDCSPARVEVTTDPEDGRRDWEDWFAPFLKLLDEHPEIEAFSFVNQDWRTLGNSAANGWLNARIEINPYIGPKWVEELRKPRYLSLPEVRLLDGYAAARASRPPYRGPGPTDPLDAMPDRFGGRMGR